MLLIKPEHPVPPFIVELLIHVQRAAQALDLPFFVAGAFARDLLLLHVHGFRLPRPTRDVDIGVAVRDWNDFARLHAELIRTGEFSEVRDVAHRLQFRKDGGRSGVPLDVVPFQGVDEGDGVLRWPPRGHVVMNVAGFEEALRVAEEVRISDELTVRVASLAGQALLKLAAWLDRHHETPRDAHDLLVLFRRYGDAGNADRLYGDKAILLEGAGYDMERAGAALLGEDVRAIAAPQHYARLAEAYAAPALRDTLLTHVSSAAQFAGEHAVERAQTLIEAFFTGFRAR
jgi:predicted nucleotidyltransferase